MNVEKNARGLILADKKEVTKELDKGKPFSYYLRPISNTYPNKDITLPELIEIIRSNRFKKPFEALQSIQGTTARSDYKCKEFDCITATGIFSQRGDNFLLEPSGFFVGDIDDQKDAKKIKEELIKDPLVVAAFYSPSGNGLKIFVRIDPVLIVKDGSKRMLKVWTALNEYLRRNYSHIITSINNCYICDATKDSSRACFLSYDPEAFFNLDKDTFIDESFCKEYTQIVFDTEKKKKKINNHRVTLLELHKEHLTDDNHHAQVVKFAGAAHHYRYSADEIFNYIQQEVKISPESAHSDPEILRKNIDDIVGRYPNNSTNTASIVVDYLIQENIQRNEITGQFEQEGKVLSEQDLNTLFVRLQIDNKKINKQLYEIVLNSNLLPSFNPLKNFIRDNQFITTTGHIKKLVDSLVLKSHAYDVEVFIRKWLVGMMASIFDDNYNPLMLVLVGPKGCGKTEFFRRLLPLKNYFAQSKFNDGKDSEALMSEYLLILNDELDGLHAREARAFRNFLSASYYYYRPPYAKSNIRRKRLATVCGASNDTSIITDVENNRRIIPIEITGVNHALYNSIDKTALLMEAYHLYQEGYNWNLTENEMEDLTLISQKHEITCVEFELIQKYVIEDLSQEMTPTEVLNELMKKTPIKININKIGSSLQRCGFKQIQKRFKQSQKRIYHVTISESKTDEYIEEAPF